MTYWQYLIKVGRKKKEEEDRKKIEKYFKSSCLRELKTDMNLFNQYITQEPRSIYVLLKSIAKSSDQLVSNRE